MSRVPLVVLTWSVASVKSGSKVSHVSSSGRKLRTPGQQQDKPPAVSQAMCCTWTCPVCNEVLYAGSAGHLNGLRKHHGSSLHPDVPAKVLHQKYKLQVAVATEAIPSERMAWKCPLCPMGLPHLDSRRARHLAVAAHKRQHHPEVATKTWQAKMCKSRVTGTKNTSVSQCQKKKFDAFRHQKFKSHLIIEVKVDDLPKAASFRNRLQYWCTHCLAKVGRYGGSSGKSPNKGLSCSQMRKLPRQQARLRRQWFALQHRVPTNGEPLWPQLSQWVRDLVEDGDVEPNPGSSSSASSRRMPAKQLNRCNINVNGPPAICSVLRNLPESDVILCQETAFPSVKAWTLVRPWEWQHPTLGAVQLHHVPADPPALERVQRVLRESMRIYYFQQFLQWGRREAEECSQNGVTYLEARCTKAPKMCNSQKRFTVLAGGMISPAAISIMRGLDAPSMCPWCGEQQVPTLEHVAWQCTGPDEVRIQHHVQNIRISCPMQKRLGWPTLMAHDEQVLDWLCYVRKRFLDHRFRASP